MIQSSEKGDTTSALQITLGLTENYEFLIFLFFGIATVCEKYFIMKCIFSLNKNYSSFWAELS